MTFILYWVLYAVVMVPPFWVLLPRFGLPSYVACLAVFPILAVGLLWIMAFGHKLNLPGGPGKGEH